MAFRLINPRDLEFVLYELLTVERLAHYPRFAEHARATFDAAIDTAARLAESHFANHHRKSDLNEPRLVDGKVLLIPEVKAALDAFAQAGFLAAHHAEAQGGMQLPWVICQACAAHFLAANIATYAYPFLTVAAANLIDAFGSDDQKARYLPQLLDGRSCGTMVMSEPDVGSSLGDIRTTAHPLGNHRFAMRGTKMWISGGEHELSSNIVHLVLARIQGAPAGPKGLSLFIVPRFRLDDDGERGEPNDVALAGLNHKMGYRGTVNTVLGFGEQGDCVGELIGGAGQGLAIMFHMMNEARIGVGLGAIMQGYAGYLYALDYAQTRLQGRPAHAKDPHQPPIPIIEHADVKRMLLAQKVVVEGGLALSLYAALLVDRQKHDPDQASRDRSGLLLDLLTPIIKAWGSDHALTANCHAIQVLGGYGYTRDHPVEQFYRDNRLNPIHEGTNGIQALDLLGRKVMMDDGAALEVWLQEATRTGQEAQGVPSSLLPSIGRSTACAKSPRPSAETSATLWRSPMPPSISTCSATR